MGELVGRMMVNVLQLQQENESPGETDEPWFVFRFTVETDAKFFGQLEKDMRSLVDVRTALTQIPAVLVFRCRWRFRNRARIPH